VPVQAIKVAVLQERAPSENRVALVPEVISRVLAAGMTVTVEAGAGTRAFFSDSAYAQAGATVRPGMEATDAADIVLCLNPPASEQLARLRPGQALIGLLGVRTNPSLVAQLAAAGLTAISLDLLPRTLSRAQSMDALTSQANVAGYKAVLVAAAAYGRYLPMLMTAAGTAKPAAVLVLGAGVAGLQAIGTARRLGAVVTGYDVRPQTRAEVESLGARFLELPAVGGAGEGGYARALTEAEQAAQQQALDERIAGFDIVITTAQVPGGRPPILVTDAALKAMRPGSVLVDLACGPLGGNVEGSQNECTLVLHDGVTVIGAGNLPATVPAAASTAYARNLSALLGELVRDGELRLDRSDEVIGAVLVTHGGEVVHPELATSSVAS
jgi:NAD(P) transhydrogenase subunit alpha